MNTKNNLLNLFLKWRYWLLLFLIIVILFFVLRPLFEKGKERYNDFIIAKELYESEKEEKEYYEQLYIQQNQQRQHDQYRYLNQIKKSDQLINELLEATKNIQNKRDSINLDTLNAIQRFDRITRHLEGRR